MTILVDEIGTVAAQNIDASLRSAGAGAWRRLAAGGWAALGADTDAGLDVRAIQEVARVTGRYPVSTPLIPTLLAGRWFQPSADQMELGIGIALPHGDRLAVPYFSSSMVTLDAAGEPLSLAGREIADGSLTAAIALRLLSATGAMHGPSAQPDAEPDAVVPPVAAR